MKAKILTFVRGLMNGTPPRFQSYLKSLILLVAVVASVNAWGTAVSGTFSKHTGVLEEGDYVIVYGSYALANSTSSSRFTNGSPTISNNAITNPDESIVWHIARNGDYWTIYNAKVSKYAGGNGSKNQGALIASVTDYAKFSVSTTSESTTYDFENYGCSQRASNSGNKWLRNNTTNGWACYSSSTGGAVTLYKKSSAKTDVSLSVGANGSLKAYSNEACTSEITISSNKISVDQNSTVYFKATPNTGYVVDSWTGATVNPSDNTKASLAVGTTEATVSVSFKAPASHDITWYANGQQVAQNNQQEGATLTIPADPDPATYCDGKTFVGWTATQNYSHATTAPGDLFTSADSKTVGSTTAYYAVFADKDLSDSETEKKPTFALANYSSLPSAWTTTATAGSSYLQMKTDEYVQNMDLKTAGILADGEILSSAMSVVVSCGTYQTWSSPKSVKVTVDLLDASSKVLTTHNTTFTSLTNSESADKAAISVALPTDPTQFAGIKITVSDFNSGTILRFKNVKLTYKVKTIAYSNYTTTCAPTYEATVADGILNGSVLISKTDDAMAGAASLTGLKQGDKVYIFPTANTGYKLDAVTVNGTPITDTEGKYIYTIAEEGITVSATFVPATYQITYNLDGGEWNGEAGVATYTYGIGATLPTEDDVIKANNTFLGWFLNNEGDVATTVIGTTETGDKSFTARWLASGSKNVTIDGDNMLLTYTPFKPTTVDKDAENLTIDYSIEKGYTISAVAVTVNDAALTEGEVEFNDEQLTIAPNGGFTGNVAIAFTVVEKMFTVTWMANKTQFKQEQIQEGSKVSLPAETPSDVISGEDTYKFQGWTVDEQYSNETTAPSYITSNTIEPTGDVTYYAVYAMKESQASSTTFVKGTLADLTTGQKVVIVEYTDNMALTSTPTSDTYNLKNKSVSPSNNKITSVTEDIKWTVTKNNSTYQFKQGDNYLYGYNDGAGHYNLKFGSTSDSWTIASAGTGYTLESGLYSGYKIEYFNSKFTIYSSSGNAFNMHFYIPETTETTKNYRTRVAIIDHIAVNGTPIETKFVAGETFDATGLTIDVYYQDEVEPTNVTTGFTYDPNGTLATSNDKITFSYQGKTADVAISVSNTVSSIEVTTNPTKKEYTEGEQFNPEGMVVTATYDNDAERVVTGYTYTPTGDLALGDEIEISFGGQKTNLEIIINPAAKTTVNWYVNGVKLTEGEQSTAVISGKKITILPTEPDACQGNQFVGWTAVDANYYNATTAPTDLFKTLVASPIIGETETNFYAVFASEAVGTYDEKVTLTSLTAPTADKFTYAFAKSSGSNSPLWNADQAKTYVKNTLTVTSKNSRVITKIEYTYNINNGNSGPPTDATVTGNNSDNGSWDATNKTWTSSTNAATAVTLTVNGSSGNYGFTAIKVYLTGGTVLSDYSTTCLAALATPTIITAEGEYCGFVDVEITQPAGNPDGAKIMYSTDNETWNEYTAAVNITTSGTVYAKVVKDPKQTDVVSATYTVYPAYTLAQAATAASATSQIACLTFTDLLVQARTLSEAFLKASDGQIVLLSKSSHGLQVGDKLVADNAHLNFIKSHDLLQLTSMDGIEKNGTGTPVADVKTITEITSANYGQLVKIMNVTYDATNKKFTDASSNEIAIDAKFFIGGSLPSSWPDGGKFNATGVVVLDNNSNAVIAPRNTDDLESLAMPLLPPTNFVVASVNSYQASYTWTAVEGNNGYTLYIYDGDNQIYKSSAIAKTRTDYAPTTALEAGHNYTAKLVALGDKVEHSDSPAAEVGFTTNPNAKLNWYKGGSLYQTTYASQEKVVTPEDPESPCATNYENFVTWYTEEIVSETGQITALEAAKKVKAGDAAASQAGSAKEYNFYAVFGKIKTAGTDKYVKVTETITDKDGNEDWRGEFLIGLKEENTETLVVFDGHRPYMDGTTNEPIDDPYNSQSVTLQEEGTVVLATEDINSYRFIFTKSTTEGKYNIQSASGYYIGGSPSSNTITSSTTTKYDNGVKWDAEYNEGIEILSGRYLCYNADNNQKRFRYMSNNAGNLVLYKRTKTNPTYNGYITTCPVTYTITIAENAKGVVEAATTTEILKGASVKLTATANAGYTKTGGAWVVKKTATSEVVEGLVGGANYLTMPDYDVTIDYDFQEIKDQFVDNLHGNSTIEKGGANYELPTLSDFSETTGAPSDNFKKFIGWSATSYDSGEPATEQPTILEGEQTATGATYFAVWHNGFGQYITEYCQTSAPANLHLVEEYHKATSVRIDWNNVDGADKYHIFVMDGEAETIADADVTESVYDLSGLTPGATYICTVKAHKDCWSDETGLEFETKENIQSYAVTINAEGGTYTIDPTLEDGKIQEGATVTITNIAPTDADHYFFKELTVPEATDLTEITGGYKFTMPGKAVTINIVFAEYPTVTWKMEGAADQTSIAVRNGDKFVIGADNMQSAPADWKYKTYFPEFAGWVTSDKCDADGNVTTAEFITATTEVPADGLTVYGAVAKSSAPDCSTATKITSNENLDMSALYVIGTEYNTTTIFYNSIDGSWGRTTQEVSDKTPIIFTISGTKDALALLGSDGNYIQGYSSKTFGVSDSKKTIVLTAEGKLNNNTSWYLNYNYNTGSGGLRWYENSNSPAYLYKVGLTYDNLTINPQPDYGRTDLVVGNYGTVCVPYAVKTTDRSGATFWSIETSNAIGSTNPTSVTIVQHEGDLVAGKPYIFYAEETTMSLFFSGDKYEASESVPANGLYGNLTEETITINDQNDPNAGPEPTRGFFFVLQQKLYECGWNCTVGPNRGWVQAAAIEDETTPSPAPRRVIGNPNGTPTGINNLNVDGWVDLQGAHKYLYNNHIMIVNEGRIYNAQGILIQ